MKCDICKRAVVGKGGRGRPPKRHPECRKIRKSLETQTYRYRAKTEHELERRVALLTRLLATAERALERSRVIGQGVASENLTTGQPAAFPSISGGGR